MLPPWLDNCNFFFFAGRQLQMHGTAYIHVQHKAVGNNSETSNSNICSMSSSLKVHPLIFSKGTANV